jgi:hypothetical protein
MRQYHDVHTARSTLRAKQKQPSQQRELDVVYSVSEQGAGEHLAACLRALLTATLSLSPSLRLSVSLYACLSVALAVSARLGGSRQRATDGALPRSGVHKPQAAAVSEGWLFDSAARGIQKADCPIYLFQLLFW